jgi:hypothetical protein
MTITRVEFCSIPVDREIDRVILLLTSEQFKNFTFPSLHLEDEGQKDTCFLDIFYHQEYGYHIYGAGKDDLDYYVMREEKEDDFIVEAFLGGADIKCHYHNFVSEEKMLQAVSFFHAESRLDPDLLWAKESDEYMDDIYY